MTVTSNITNAQLAAQIQALIQSWQTRENQMIAWLAGTAGGGDYSNGTYPLSDAFGNVQYIESPAQMAADVTTTVGSATAQATAAAASATSAASASAAAVTARNLASTYASNAAASATQAANSQSAAATNAASALASKNAAASSAASAASSVSSIGTSVSDAAASATAAASSATGAAASATAAAASAAAAETFNPSLYGALTGATFTGQITVDGVLTFHESLASNNGSVKNALLDANDGYLRLNNSSNFTNGVYTPGNLRTDGSLYVSPTVHFVNSDRTYGSLDLAGGSGGYVGLVLNDNNLLPTFMSNGSDHGVYLQGPGRWTWYDDGTNFRVVHPITDVAAANAYLHHTSGHTSGNVTVSTSAPSGGSDGDIWLQHS